jgi:hypothetical protein
MRTPKKVPEAPISIDDCFLGLTVVLLSMPISLAYLVEILFSPTDDRISGGDILVVQCIFESTLPSWAVSLSPAANTYPFDL